MAPSDLKTARKSLAGGRVDEALLFLWNALEPARLEGGRALRELERLAVEVGERGDESQRREAEKLLATLRGLPDNVEAIEARAVQQEAEVQEAEVQEREVSDRPVEADARAEPEAEPETPARRGLARYAIPAIFLLIVVVNVLARVLGD